MEPKDYDRIAKYLGKELERASFIPGLFTTSLQLDMSAHAQRKLTQAVLASLVSHWAIKEPLENADERELALFGRVVMRTLTLDDILGRV